MLLPESDDSDLSTDIDPAYTTASPEPPELALWRAVLAAGIVRAANGDEADFYWIHGHSTQVGSCRWICDILGLDRRRIWQAIRSSPTTSRGLRVISLRVANQLKDWSPPKTITGKGRGDSSAERNGAENLSTCLPMRERSA